MKYQQRRIYQILSQYPSSGTYPKAIRYYESHMSKAEIQVHLDSLLQMNLIGKNKDYQGISYYRVLSIREIAKIKLIHEKG